MNARVGHVVSVVRVLIGLPTAVAYFYMRHFDANIAYLFLAVGLALMTAGLDYELKNPALIGRRSK